MAKVFIENINKSIEYTPGKDLLSILLQNKIFVDNPCNGKGSCGKCKVKIIEGNTESISETEKNFLSSDEIKEGIRLSCFFYPKEDLVIKTLQKEGKHKILTTGYVPKFKFNPSITKKNALIEKPTLDNQIPLEDSICSALGVKNINLKLLEDEKVLEEITGVFYKDDLIAIEEGNTTNVMYGASIDIGTTTVVMSLIDLLTGEEIATESMINPQKKYGLDVLTRITYELENKEEGKKNLQYEIVNGINKMIFNICKAMNISKDNIYEIDIAANCTMMHFLLGIDATAIGRSPYTPVFVKAKTINAIDIGIDINRGGKLYCLPSVSSYIGADIVAGVYVCDLKKTFGNILFIDIGTNGEIVLANEGKLLSCSCAAGPALEGMNISSGMRAAEGAIEDVSIKDDKISFKVIGDKKPLGLCGSGILSVIKELIENGIIEKNGGFIKEDKINPEKYVHSRIKIDGKKREYILNDDKDKIRITQGDVRQVQLAKGAILSGFYALLNKANIKMEDLDKVMIAGQFGAHLPVSSLVGTGILPKEVKDKVTYIGNSSKTGAYMSLMSLDAKKDLEDIACEMDYMELGASEGYERLFSTCLLFKI